MTQARPVATVEPQPGDLFGQPAFAVIVRCAGRVTVAGIYPTQAEADRHAASINPQPRPIRPQTLRLFDL